MLSREWAAKRALLNHDVLCNQLRNELAAARQDVTHHPLTRLQCWSKREEEYRSFFNGAISAVSWAHLLDATIFRSWTSEMRECFRPIVHECFAAATNIDFEVSELHRLLTASLEGVSTFLNTPAVLRRTEDAETVLATLDALSSAISGLPHAFDDAD